MTSSDRLPIAVVGGGISGITVAVEAAETGRGAVIIEKDPWLGGRVFAMHKYFPKLCPPLCGMEINFRRIRGNPSISVITDSEVESVSGSKGEFTLKIRKAPRLIKPSCTACNRCAEVCQEERPDDFNFGMGKTKAAYMRHPMAFPAYYAIDPSACKGVSCSKCVEACKYDAIDLTQKPEIIELKVASVVYATGWKPYDASRIETLGFGKVSNVITNVMMERLAAPSGPTGGRIRRPSDGMEVENVAFVQCAGSRDENHLPYCSSICCLATLKHATYLREQSKNTKVTIFYIDIRTPGKYEAFYQKVGNDPGISFMKGKVAKVKEDPQSKDVIITVEDVMAGQRREFRTEMLVLATGMQPNASSWKRSAFLDRDGFMMPDKMEPGIFAAGVARNPVDVSTAMMDSTSVVLKCLGSGAA